MNSRAVVSIFGLLLLAGCASQKPVLYPNDAINQRGQAAGDQAIQACEARAKSSGVTYSKGNIAQGAVENGVVGGAGGAVAGAIFGDAARGAAGGAAGGVAAGLVRNMFHPNRGPAPAYQAYVNRCLRDQGYDPVGWN